MGGSSRVEFGKVYFGCKFSDILARCRSGERSVVRWLNWCIGQSRTWQRGHQIHVLVRYLRNHGIILAQEGCSAFKTPDASDDEGSDPGSDFTKELAELSVKLSLLAVKASKRTAK